MAKEDSAIPMLILTCLSLVVANMDSTTTCETTPSKDAMSTTNATTSTEQDYVWAEVKGMIGDPLPAEKLALLCNMTQPDHTQAMCLNISKDPYGACEKLCSNIGFWWFTCVDIEPYGANDPTPLRACGCSYSGYGNKSRFWYFITQLELKDSPNLSTDQHCTHNPFKVVYNKIGGFPANCTSLGREKKTTTTETAPCHNATTTAEPTTTETTTTTTTTTAEPTTTETTTAGTTSKICDKS